MNKKSSENAPKSPRVATVFFGIVKRVGLKGQLLAGFLLLELGHWAFSRGANLETVARNELKRLGF